MAALTTPAQIEAFQMATLIHAFKLEKLGMKMARGVNLRAMWAARLGLTPRASYDKFIQAATARKEELMAAVQTA